MSGTWFDARTWSHVNGGGSAVHVLLLCEGLMCVSGGIHLLRSISGLLLTIELNCHAILDDCGPSL